MSSPSERTSFSRMPMRRFDYKNRDRPGAGGSAGRAVIFSALCATAGDGAEVAPAEYRHHHEHDPERDRQRPVDVAHRYRPIDTPNEPTLSYVFGPEYGLARRKKPTRPPTPSRNIRCASAPRYVVSGAALRGSGPVRMPASRTSKP